MGHPQFSGRGSAADFTPAPCGHDGLIVLAPILEFPPKVDAPGLGRGDPLGLPLAAELPLCLGNIAQQLKDDVSDQHPGEIPPLTGIQQRHIQYHDGHLFFLCEQVPLLQNLVVVSSQPVDALDDKGVPGF